MIEYLSGQELEDVLTDDLTIVDYFAEWCGPCKMMGEVLKQLNGIKIIKVNVDEHESLAQEHGVMSIPTIEIYQNKEMISKFIGFKTKDEIEEIIANINND